MMVKPMTDRPGAGGETRADLAYQAIRDAIGAGTLRPGQKVTERGLAEQLDVSPTPVREALRRLEQDGLIERTGPRTVVVADIAERAVDDLAEVEIGLRGLVARFAARHATPGQLDALDAILDAADDLLIVIVTRHRNGEDVERHVAALLDRMQEFNDAVNACAANPVLIRLLEQSQVFSRPRRRALRLEKIAEDARFGLDRYSSHRALVRALRAGDSATAERLVIEDAQGGLSDLREKSR
ncbi:GntR family transcriptional regulator [Actinomadura madurae]|uniref:GntR family transcriptional regulator n=1 Tax=Actinomadura madurae TaxID=1993 RepID=UPI002026975C|nr:GntR family transcriptional regulator [Actinomadura madurae]MCP9951363.1 GntR family transcriptional regulator [Actinomadura madurae]MCP9968136.1 GntR family transcriptional regulator [Actinomadura madurae]MCP9980596.1 GntR family transcriptional regulator [Actinomadura madurae]MCQ0007890.1 GntR family transcriptional regulator [Actinomadura madurae]MCQ0016798.1 GntR family transcriptional regulator [Actinomadura madurae]